MEPSAFPVLLPTKHLFLPTFQGPLEKVKDVGHKIEHEIEKDIDLVAEKTHMKPW